MIKYSDEIKEMNLWEKVANISAEIGNLQKDDSVGTGSNSYKAISIEKVVKAVGEKMNKYGVVVYPIQQQYTRTDEKVKGIDYKTKAEVEKINRISDVDVTYQVVNIHNPQETMITVASGTGVDTQDKGIGKAQTYAYKNMLLKLFAIATGDDTDKIHSDDYTNKLYGAKQENINEESREKLYNLAKEKGLSMKQIDDACLKDYGYSLPYISLDHYKDIFTRISKVTKKG
ncbi:ERF family protein [Clostridium sp.]|uniref:ERF family protein n=1 Tax=Clostridium sp. TaxID=1506 RepID=UPI003F2A51A6